MNADDPARAKEKNVQCVAFMNVWETQFFVFTDV